MYKYLVDLASKKVLLRVEGPIRIKPGRALIEDPREIRVSKARYDAKAESITEVTESTLKRSKRSGLGDKQARMAQERAKAQEFVELLGNQSEDVQRLFRILVTTAPGFLRQAVGEEEAG